MESKFIAIEKSECCGCNACSDACKANAITFNQDDAGFLYPTVDTKQCVNCGRCQSVCPIVSDTCVKTSRDTYTPIAYAAVANDLALRFNSTSGGIFSILANTVFSQGGYVGGAVWDQEFNVHQILTCDSTELAKLQNSKYVQSDARGFYLSVAEAISTGKKVLVCGLPCQMAALRAYLNHDYENLLIIDLVCKSVGSPAFLKECIKYLEHEKNDRVVFIKQKDKGLGWRSIATRYDFAKCDSVYIRKDESIFMQAYCNDLISRDSCYNCKFKGMPRVGDLTIADCWGVADKIPEEFDHDLGTSLIICNNRKGEAFFSSIRQQTHIKTTEIKIEEAINANSGITNVAKRSTHSATELTHAVANGDLSKITSILFARQKPSLFEILKRNAWLLLTQKLQIFRLIGTNGIFKTFSGGPIIFPDGKLLFQLDGNNVISTSSDMHLGCSMVKGSRIESRFRLMDGAKIEFNGGCMGVGAYILMFKNSKLTIGKRCSINIGFTVTCGKSIKIGNDVFIGQNVTIRDTHGDHFINTPGYMNTKPVEIGDHVWITSGAIIMPGVKIGSGAVVAARAVVTKDVPANTLVAGIPAKVIRNNIQFRC